MTFDADAAAQPGMGVFGLPHTYEEASVILLPAPFDATTSYRPGTAKGPGAIREASMQVDLFDRRMGRIYERGIFMMKESAAIARLGRGVRRHASTVIEAGGVAEGEEPSRTLRPAIRAVNAACERVNEFTYEHTKKVLEAGKTPGLVGGEHSTPFGAIRAVAEHYVERGGEVGILHLDAHMDMRAAYEGFAWSHASIMHNVMTRVPQIRKLVSVGIRDFGEREMHFAASCGERVVVNYDDRWHEQMARGERFMDLCEATVAVLPHEVYVSLDIDVLEPSNCPHTGTPVPGGLSFNQAMLLLDVLRGSGRRVVGFDLVEVAPGRREEPEWDANVGARVLYKLCGLAGG